MLPRGDESFTRPGTGIHELSALALGEDFLDSCQQCRAAQSRDQAMCRHGRASSLGTGHGSSSWTSGFSTGTLSGQQSRKSTKPESPGRTPRHQPEASRQMEESTSVADLPTGPKNPRYRPLSQGLAPLPRWTLSRVVCGLSLLWLCFNVSRINAMKLLSWLSHTLKPGCLRLQLDRDRL